METNRFLNYWNLFLQYDEVNPLVQNLHQKKVKIQNFREK